MPRTSWLQANGKQDCMPPVPEELATVGRILALSISDRSYARIASELNADSVPTKRTRCWHASTVRGIVQWWDQYTKVLDDF